MSRAYGTGTYGSGTYGDDPTTFTPPVALDVLPTSREGTPQGNRLMRQFGSRARGRSVLRIGGAYQTVDTPSQALIDSASEVYIGGHEYPVDSDTASALAAAGFGDGLS